ncbi:MAG: serine hydrolase [Chloroflexi bacterium]|nr:serine hydrolase [Chloroflexota bacterium]MBU1751105.1 serine hydrolase [Chloroflexota bacterium]
MKSLKGLLSALLILVLCSAALLSCEPARPLTPTPPPATPTVGPPIPPEVQDHVRALVDNDYSMSIVVALVDASGTTFYSYGKMSKDGAPVNDRTIYEIGSISKVFTAILLADLVERGVVTLDDPVEKYLPPEVRVPERNGKKITLAYLVTHRSGLPRMPTNWNPQDPDNPYVDYTVEDLYEFLSSYTLPRDPGDQYEYSNAGAGLLGHVLARISGTSYEQLVIDRICRPLGMDDTVIALSEEQRGRLARGHLALTGGQETANWDLLDSLAGAGALRSSAMDMARFAAANLGLYQTDLYPALKRAQQARADTDQPGGQIGLGWQIGTIGDIQIVGHDGGTGGYRSSCNLAPSRNAGVVVLSNSNYGIGGVSIGYIGVHVLAPQVALPRVRKPIPVAPSVLAAYVGTYEQPDLELVLDVTVENGTLMIQARDKTRYPIYPESETEFFYKDMDVQITFQKDDQGSVVALVMHAGGQDYTAKKIQ